MDRANLPGTRANELFSWDIQPLSDSEGTLSVQEYIQAMCRSDPKDVVRIVRMPENGTDERVWIYEQLRQFLLESNLLVAALAHDCHEQSCPKMVVAKWEILCAAHKKPKECSAIDYIIHTLTGFKDLINNKDMFPSRVRIPPESMENLKAVPRRLVRVFAHAFFNHRQVFDQFEQHTFLCSRFVAFAKMFRLLSDKDIMISIDQLPVQINL
jgi:hypothetical protein